MKKIFYSGIFVLLSSLAFTSCSDMLDTDSTRQNIDPSVSQKTDSVFYSYGILQAMQQLADQYVFQGEMRGELVKTTRYTDNNLRQLADFSAGTDNKYDSAYVYYRVINNCNYYIAHCDTNMYNGSTNVIIDKYAATKAIRAWAYLQLARNWGKVPFFTEPLTQISQIDRNYPEMDIQQITAELAPDLEQYSGFLPPMFGTPNTIYGIGSPNWESSVKYFSPMLSFIPVDVVLGDLYLESGRYSDAARHFVTYLTKVVRENFNGRYSRFAAPMQADKAKTLFSDDDNLPTLSQIAAIVSFNEWSSIFGRNSIEDIVSYIPMASTSQNGTTTIVPLTFGFNYYATAEERSLSGEPYTDEIQLLPSDELQQLSDSTEYYYYASYKDQKNSFDSVAIAKAGDMRLRSIMYSQFNSTRDSITQWIDKYKYANIVLYRVSTVWLRLAECFNRLDMPEVAFAILKDGISDKLLEVDDQGNYSAAYLTDYCRQQLQTNYPLLSDDNLNLFPGYRVCGIHGHGAGGATSDYAHWSTGNGSTYITGVSPYSYDRIIGRKLAEIQEFDTLNATRQDTINAMEDIICDEYALELAFEGCRYYDLLRIAGHKNRAGLYSANYGDLWLSRKLGTRGWTPAKKYLPFK